MAATHTEAVLNKLSKQELLPLFANTEANLVQRFVLCQVKSKISWRTSGSWMQASLRT